MAETVHRVPEVQTCVIVLALSVIVGRIKSFFPKPGTAVYLSVSTGETLDEIRSLLSPEWVPNHENK